MLPKKLIHLIQHSEAYLQRRTAKEVSFLSNELLRIRFSLCRNCLEKRRGAQSALHDDINYVISNLGKEKIDEIIKMHGNVLKNRLMASEFDALPIRQISRFFSNEGEPSNLDLDILLTYLHIPEQSWVGYYSTKEVTVQDFFGDEMPNIKLTQEQIYLAQSWYAYMYSPAKKTVYRLPIILEKASDYHFRVWCRTIINELYQGQATFYGDYLIIHLTNKAKTEAVSLQTFIDYNVLSGSLILSCAAISVKDKGKLLLSVLILDRVNQQSFSKEQFPSAKALEIKHNSKDGETEKINEFIQYIARKGDPELLARYFHQNNVEEIEKRNDIEAKISMRPRMHYNQLISIFNHGGGKWYSLSRIYPDIDIESVSVFECTFKANDASRIIKVVRKNQYTKIKFEGVLQYQQKHISMFLTAQESFKHFLAPVDLNRSFGILQKTDLRKSGFVIKGSSSTIHDNVSYLIKEILVFTNKLNSEMIVNGCISFENLKRLEILDDHDINYLYERKRAVLFDSSKDLY